MGKIKNFVTKVKSIKKYRVVSRVSIGVGCGFARF